VEVLQIKLRNFVFHRIEHNMEWARKKKYALPKTKFSRETGKKEEDKSLYTNV